MRRVRILHVIPTLDQSGAEKQLWLLAGHLPPDQFEVHVCALTRGGHYEGLLRGAGIPVHVLGKRLRWDPLLLWRLYRLVRRLAPDLVQTWLFSANCYGRVAGRLAGVPHLLATERCVDQWKHPAELAIDRMLAGWTDVVVANSQAVADFYARVGIPRQRIRVISNAWGTDDDPEPLADRDSRLAELGIDPARRIIGFVGRLWPQKRVEDLICAIDVLRIGGWQPLLLIVGQGPRRPALERLVDRLLLHEFVRFLGHRTDAQALLAAMDVVVVPSSFEGTPNAILEAMRAARPVVASRIPGMDELVVHGQTGLLVEPARPFELAAALRTLLEDAGLRTRMGLAGRERARQSFSLARMVVAYASLYQEQCG